MSISSEKALDAIRQERTRQLIEFHPSHDQQHTLKEWRAIRKSIEREAIGTVDSYDPRGSLIQIAAVCVAQYEAWEANNLCGSIMDLPAMGGKYACKLTAGHTGNHYSEDEAK